MAPSGRAKRSIKLPKKYENGLDDKSGSEDDTPPSKTASNKRKSNDDDNNNPPKSAKTTTTTTHTSITTKKDYNKNEALFKQFDSATSKVAKVGDVGYKFYKDFNGELFCGYVVEIRPLAEGGKDRRCVYSDYDGEDLTMQQLESLPNNNNNSRTSTDTPMNSESLPTTNNTKGDEDCIVQRVDNSKSAAAINKDGGSGTGITEKRSSSIDTMAKGVSITKDCGGSIAKDSDMCVDVDTMAKGGSITKDADVDVAGGGKTAGLEFVVELCRPQLSKARGLNARSEWGEDIKNDEAVRLGFVKLSADGKSFNCYLCDATVKARHPFSPDSYMGKTGHKYTDKHEKNLQAKLWNMDRAKQRAAQGKKPDKEVKYGRQTSMIGFFRRGPTSTATTSRPSTSTTSRSVATSTSAAGTNTNSASTQSATAAAGKF